MGQSIRQGFSQRSSESTGSSSLTGMIAAGRPELPRALDLDVFFFYLAWVEGLDFGL